MRVLFFDPGAERMGWSVIESSGVLKGSREYQYIDSGITRCKREDGEKFEHYKLRLELFWSIIGMELITKYEPDEIGNEIVPAVGSGNFAVATQSDLAKAAITVVHVLAFQRNIPIRQIGASTLKKNLTGTNKATKVRVRNKVIELYPQLEHRRAEWIKEFDESDAIGGGTVHLGYKNG